MERSRNALEGLGAELGLVELNDVEAADVNGGGFLGDATSTFYHWVHDGVGGSKSGCYSSSGHWQHSGRC